MRKLISYFLIISTFLTSCKLNNPDKPAANADTEFRQLSDSFLLGYLAWRPQGAVGLGFHEYDGKLNNISKGSIGKELNRLRDYEQRLEALDTSALSAKMFFDLRILK